jgi:predicted HicB family RNase H-like nuclease
MQNPRVATTKIRGVRIDDELWEAAQEKAAKRRESVADVIRRALLDYIED